jgi:hypothetical protein
LSEGTANAQASEDAGVRYDVEVGSLRTSEDDVVVAGEGRKSDHDDDRAVDAGAKIVITPGQLAPLPPEPSRPVPRPTTPPRRGGLWIVILAYLLGGAALAFAIYERYFA